MAGSSNGFKPRPLHVTQRDVFPKIKNKHRSFCQMFVFVDSTCSLFRSTYLNTFSFSQFHKTCVDGLKAVINGMPVTL